MKARKCLIQSALMLACFSPLFSNIHIAVAGQRPQTKIISLLKQYDQYTHNMKSYINGLNKISNLPICNPNVSSGECTFSEKNRSKRYELLNKKFPNEASQYSQLKNGG
jgi:hypothetical protein